MAFHSVEPDCILRNAMSDGHEAAGMAATRDRHNAPRSHRIAAIASPSASSPDTKPHLPHLPSIHSTHALARFLTLYHAFALAVVAVANPLLSSSGNPPPLTLGNITPDALVSNSRTCSGVSSRSSWVGGFCRELGILEIGLWVVWDPRFCANAGCGFSDFGSVEEWVRFSE